ncbi:uncharacterized protein TM35_000102620 [Trypanosoma theileri]|uniref:Uncharacterized protein n=1 Tax=Trypanosoma theileri TaxID=67003 RepID=A0A1X0NZ77_9TRYP|nr:uncharacterized protein TM35_000102620 [Trypanosoma theileri]ORC89994.1 hypothetical protein TM35_000102620 [Trypanosoma theileri]
MCTLSLSLSVVLCSLPCVLNVRIFSSSTRRRRSKQSTVTIMTTMFVQLHRVVYLLVLLQSCACVVNANGVEGQKIIIKVPQGDITKVKEIDDNREAENGERRLRELVNQAYRLYLEGKSCVAVLRKETEACKKNKEIAKGAAEKTKAAVEALQKEWGTGVPRQEGDIAQEKLASLKSLVGDAEKKIEESKNAVAKETSVIQRTKYARTACWISYDDLNDEVRQLNATREGLEGMFKEHRTPAREDLVKNATKTGDDLYWLTQEVRLTLRRGRDAKTEAETEFKKADDILKGALRTLETVTAEVQQKITKNEGHANLKEFQKVVNESEKALKEVTLKSNAIAEPAPGLIQYAGNTYEESYAREEKENPVTHNKRIFEELRKKVALAEIQDELKKAEQEAARLLAEKIIQEEEEKNRRIAEEERKRQETLAEEERRKRERVAEEERRKQEKLAEEETKKREKLAEEERKKREKLALEKKAKEEAERARVAAEKAKKKRDGSVSPALVHNSLPLLVVICVLGCTLVC